MSKFILLTNIDPWLQFAGGTSAFARQILQQYKNEIVVAAMTTEDIPKGKWIYRSYENTQILFLNLGVYKNKKRFIPTRIYFLLSILLYNRKLREIGVKNIFIDTPEVVFVLSKKWDSICYFFHGLNNPVANSRYKSLQFLGDFFEKKFINYLAKLKPTSILAAADEKTKFDFYERTKINKKIKEIILFPTRVDDNIFYPINDINSLKNELGISNEFVFTVTGRLAWIKGWDLIIDAFNIFLKKHPDSLLIFVGDGEDKNKIENKISSLKLESQTLITGLLRPEMVAKYINIANLCLVGSFYEGWSVAMCEMLACGKSIVSTNISGAEDMIINGTNGMIVYDRNPIVFSNAMESIINLDKLNLTSIEISKRFLLANLKSDFENCWTIN